MHRTVAGPVLEDAALAAALTAAGIAGTALRDALTGSPMDPAGLALAAAAGAALVLRRRRPLAVLAVVIACTSVYLLCGYPYGPILLSFMIAVYSAARHEPPARSTPWAVAALPLLSVHLFTQRAALLGLFGLIPVSTWVVVPFAVGYLLRTRRETAERVRTETVRQRVDEERLRIAQEVHDIVGHGLTAIKMQADIALHLLDRKPDQAELALRIISRTSSAALDELRATLAVVRRAGADAELSPAPGLAGLAELQQRMAEAGLEVHVATTGRAPAELPAAVDLAGYRVVQESLTNVLRHSGARQADVGIRYQPGWILVTVSNPPGEPETAPAGGGGSGIAGMRERVLALGGEFTAGPGPDGRFTVHARLPAGGQP
ncbi:sensor histidine kinase [Peterkaempfera sp. SMS 1(5)a]|uniref:sensor histidine kinase n=1 Tax=Peterkaempfera podocarpi TaxID=3232308 RepID=UPI00366ED391